MSHVYFLASLPACFSPEPFYLLVNARPRIKKCTTIIKILYCQNANETNNWGLNSIQALILSKTQTQLTTDDSAKFRPSLTFQTHRSLLPFSKKKTSSICQNKSGCDLLLLTIQLSEKSIKSDFEFYLIQVVCIFQSLSIIPHCFIRNHNIAFDMTLKLGWDALHPWR